MLQGLQQSEGEGKHCESMQLFDTDIMKVKHAAMHRGRSVAETEGGSSPQARRFDFLSWSEPGWRPGIPAAASSAFHHAGGGDEAARSLLAWITTEAPEEEPGHYPQSDMQVGIFVGGGDRTFTQRMGPPRDTKRNPDLKPATLFPIYRYYR